MMRHTIFLTVFAAGVFAGAGTSAQQPHSFEVQVNRPKADIQPTMWGVFFEDINFAADGGIYAELIKNRSFEFTRPLMGWREERPENGTGRVLVINRGLDENNPRFARVTVGPENAFGLTNEGFRGIGVKADNRYHFSILARRQEGSVKLRLELADSAGKPVGKASLEPVAGKEWKKYTVSFKSAATDPKAKLTVWFEGEGVIDIDMVSLFPHDTWKNRPGGLRADLVQMLADLKPGFLRFPGGCIVEGFDLPNRYQWKKTVGDVEDRKLIINRWNTEFRHRFTPDYFQSFGLGFFEYFQLAEDLGAEPLPILSCGMACQFNSAEVVPMDQLDPYIQDALDLIEFANGPAGSRWGKVRTDMGHPAPFNLKYIGVGNEQWGPQYIERYEVFTKAIKAKYPDIIVVTGTGPFAGGELFEFADKKLRALGAELIDEHYYMPPDWFLKNAGRYDAYDRNGPKIFAGEYAAHSRTVKEPEKKNNWESALCEAAFMTGLERNADVVHLCSYAPLFAHVEGWQWAPDLIWFDNLHAFGTPNYYVQKLFSTNKGTQVLPMLMKGQPATGQEQLYASAVLDKSTNEVIFKIVNTSESEQRSDIALKGIRKLGSKGTWTVLTSENMEDMNSLDAPENISPAEQTISTKGKKLSVSLAPRSLNVVRIKVD